MRDIHLRAPAQMLKPICSSQLSTYYSLFILLSSFVLRSPFSSFRTLSTRRLFSIDLLNMSSRQSLDRYYKSFTEEVPSLLGEVLSQEMDVCWAIAPTRQLEYILKSNNLIGLDSSLSIQEVIDVMPRKFLDNYQRLAGHEGLDALAKVFNEVGTVLSTDNPLEYRFDKEEKLVSKDRLAGRFRAITTRHSYNRYEGDDFETEIQQCLQSSPVAARILLVDAHYKKLGKSVYRPIRISKNSFGHLILITGEGVDSDGNEFFEAQDSMGLSKGSNGFIRIAKGQLLITDFFHMELKIEV